MPGYAKGLAAGTRHNLVGAVGLAVACGAGGFGRCAPLPFSSRGVRSDTVGIENKMEEGEKEGVAVCAEGGMVGLGYEGLLREDEIFRGLFHRLSQTVLQYSLCLRNTYRYSVSARRATAVRQTVVSGITYDGRTHCPPLSGYPRKSSNLESV